MENNSSMIPPDVLAEKALLEWLEKNNGCSMMELFNHFFPPKPFNSTDLSFALIKTINMRNIILTEDRRLFLEPKEFVRADGSIICFICKKFYFNHPFSEHNGFDGKPYLRKLCDGTLVKL